jgi:hypothetical protein
MIAMERKRVKESISPVHLSRPSAPFRPEQKRQRVVVSRLTRGKAGSCADAGLALRPDVTRARVSRGQAGELGREKDPLSAPRAGS